MNHRPFVILALPRSRTKWVAEYLSYGGTRCHHDPTAKWGSVEAVGALLRQRRTGLVDTGLVRHWEALMRASPRVRLVGIARPLAQVMESLLTLGVPVSPSTLKELNDMLRTVPFELLLDAEELGEEAGAKALFETCLERPWNRAWWERWKDLRVQVDPKRVTEQLRWKALQDDHAT